MGSYQFPALDSAIITAEGYGTPNYAYPNNNNPFDLQPGGVEASYPSYQAGVQAGDTMLQNIATGNSSLYSPTESLSQFGATYSGGDPNFAANLSKSLGVSLSTPMSDIFTMTQANQNNPQPQSWTDSIMGQLGTYAGPGGMTLNEISALGASQNVPEPGAQVGTIKWWTIWDPARWAFAIVGGALIIGGLMTFRTTGVIIEKGANIAAKGAQLAA